MITKIYFITFILILTPKSYKDPVVYPSASPGHFALEGKKRAGYNLTSPKENPYSVLLLISSRKSWGLCTGSLLTKAWVLTAAHCLPAGVNVVYVYAGGYSIQEILNYRPAKGSQIRSSVEFYQHPMDGYDVAVLKVSNPFKITSTVKTVKLSHRPWDLRGYQPCQVTGFGVAHMVNNSHNYLRKTHALGVKKPCICSFFLKYIFGPESSRRFLCSKPEEDYGICPGDSGSALVCGGEVRGVGSLIVQFRDVKTCRIAVFDRNIRCGSRDGFSVFQDTCPVVRWINGHVRLYEDRAISPLCDHNNSSML